MFKLELYQEGLRKTRVLAVLFLVVMILAAIIQPVSHIFEHARVLRYGSHWGDETIRVYGLSAFYMMPVALFVGAPILTLSIFSFLNNRSSSDFYHAIPHKRETLFGSFIAAVLTWVIGGMWLTTAISVTIYATNPHTIIQLGSILLVLLGMSAACLLVISAITLAMTVTGTRLTNIITSGLILFLPRLLMSMFISMIVEGARVVTYAEFGLFGNFSRNIPIGFITSGFITGGSWQNNESIDQIITRGALYTFVLALIYLVAAGYLFKKRHSELAGNPGSRLIQPINRIAITFMMTLPAIAMIVFEGYEYSSVGFFVSLTFYLIALISYFAYEFFTTKRIPDLIKMVPGLLIVVGLNIGFILGISVGRSVILQEINVTTISTVKIEDLDPNNHVQSYAMLKAQGIEIADAEIVQFLGEVLNDNIREFSTSNLNNWWQGTGMRVTFNISGGRHITRHISVIDQLRLAEWFMNYEPYRALYLVIPEDFDSVNSWGEGVTNEGNKHVLNILREELQEVDFAAWYQLVGRFASQVEWDDVSQEWIEPVRYELYSMIIVRGAIDGYHYQSIFPLTELTPSTLALYQSYSRNPND